MENPVRLSESMLWQWQRNYFAAQGSQAFSSGTVPDRITNSAFIARAYARLVHAWLQDHARQLNSDEESEITLLEVGAGSGRLTYRFLRAFHEDLPKVEGIRLRYVLSDFSPDFIRFWKEHPLLQPFVDAGKLDFACYDAASDSPIILERSSSVISEGSLKQPILVIGNYFFDSLPNDIFRMTGGQLLEGKVLLSGLEGEDAGAEGLDQVQTEYHFSPVWQPYYENNDWDDLLFRYTEWLQDGTFSFPVAGLKALSFLSSLSQKGCFMIAADKGPNLIGSFTSGRHEEISQHGAVAVSVNFHAIGKWVEAQKGTVLQQSHPYHRLNVLAFQWGSNMPEMRNCDRTYQSELADFGPDDLQNLSDEIQGKEAGLPALFSVLRLADWDPDAVLMHSQALIKTLPQADELVKEAFLEGFKQCAKHHYPMGEAEDLHFLLGALSLALRAWKPALQYFVGSIQKKGKQAQNVFHAAFALLELGEKVEAERWLNMAEELGTEARQVSALRERLETKQD